MWYNGEISENLTFLASRFPALVLTGARQVGKSSLLQRLFPDHAYVSLDVPSVAEMADHDPEAFFGRYPPPVLVDEIQYAPNVFRHVKVLVDQRRHEMGRFVLTGSQKFVLMQSVSESLAGRCAVVDLEGLSFCELSQSGAYPQNLSQLAHVIARGGFPELWRDPEMPATAFCNAYLSTYLERDVRQILNVTSLRDFERFLRGCTVRCAQQLDKCALAADVGVSSKAINSWLSVLVASNQVVLLEPWFADVGKRLVKTPKLYFVDTRLACHLLGLTAETLVSSPFLGALWETAVFGEIRRHLALSQHPASIWYYRDNQQREVDFLVLAGGNAALLECKWNENPRSGDGKSIAELMALAAEKRVADLARCQGLVVCRTPVAHPLQPGVSAIPLQDLRPSLDKVLHGKL